MKTPFIIGITGGSGSGKTRFLKSLTSDQMQRTTFNIDDEEWRKWCNVDNGVYDRQGVSLKEMTDKQKETAYHLMQVSLSVKGLQLSKDIMKTDHTLREIKNGNPDYDEEYANVSIPFEAFSGKLAGVETRAIEIISNLASNVGVDVWSKYLQEANFGTSKWQPNKILQRKS